MEQGPPRWHLRLENYDRAIAPLVEAIELMERRALSELEKAGAIQRFEIVWELGWKLLGDYLTAEQSPPDAYTVGSTVRAAFAAGLIGDGDGWMAAGKLRNQMAHTYSETLRDAALAAIKGFLPLFVAVQRTMAAARARG